MRKNTTLDLTQPEKRSLAWLEQSPVCTKILDLDFNLQYMSSAGITSLKIDDVTAYYGKPFPFDLYPGSSRAQMAEALLKSTEKNEVVTLEGPLLDKEGKKLWFHSTIVPIEDDKNTIEHLMVISIEITERRKLEQDLQKSQTLFRQAEQMGKLGHWEWDIGASRLTSYSEQYAAIFDLTVEQAKDEVSSYESNVDEYIHEDDRLRYMQVTDDAYEQEQGWDIEFRIVTSTGRIVHVHERGEPIVDDQGAVIKTFGTLQDISDSKRIEEQLSYHANHDTLTGLINRREFEKRAGRLLSTVKQGNAEHALCFMDLDQFKVVNDTCGHTAGDEMLNQLGSVLMKTLRSRDTLARLGGDEFGLLMEHCSLEDAHRVVESILSAVNDYQFSWQGNTFKVSMSIGLVLMTESTSSVTALLQDADAACYIAKDKGRNCVHVHHVDDKEIVQRHGEMQWVTRLNHALDVDRFCLYAQIVAPLNDSATLPHYELLLRMIDEKGETIPPGAFLPAAERYGLSTRLDSWVINRAFAILANNPVLVKDIHFLSINLSGASLADEAFLEYVIKRLSESGVDTRKICFEITETSAIANLSKAIRFISTLKKLGCLLALDDFGSGLSSIAYLKNLPVDFLKIDGMFVRDIVDDPIDHAMVKSINEIGHLMGMQTIAEFVENNEIKSMLKTIGVDYAQGHGIAKPLPFDELPGHLSDKKQQEQ